MVITTLCHLTCFIVPLSKSYYPVLIWRGLSGALVISSLPIYLSILGDVYPPSLRSTASVISSIVVGFGMLAGQTISGFLSSRFGWRFFFLIIPIIGLVSTLALYCIKVNIRIGTCALLLNLKMSLSFCIILTSFSSLSLYNAF